MSPNINKEAPPSKNLSFTCSICNRIIPKSHPYETYHCSRDGTEIWWDPKNWGCDYHSVRDKEKHRSPDKKKRISPVANTIED